MKKARTPQKAAKTATKKSAKSAKKATKKKAATKAATKPAVTKKAAKKAAKSAVAKKALKKATKKSAKKVAKKAPAVKAVKASKKAAPKKAVKKAAAKKAVSKPVAAPKKASKKAAPKAAKKAAAKAKPAAPAAAPPVETPPAAAPAPAPALAPIPTPVATPDSPDATLLEIARLLYDKPAFHEEVRLAVEYPEEYVERFSEDLGERNISSPVPTLPWIALIDSLRRHDALVALDWTFEPDELTEGLTALLEVRGERPINVELTEGFSESTEALQMLGDRLLEAGLALVTIDSAEPEDAFPVTVIDADAFDAAAQLAMQLGLGSIQRWSSEDQE